jgi:excisionase family DNA binding protein
MANSKSKNSAENPPLTKLAYTRDEAAQVLGVHPITISRLTEKGALRPNRSTRRPLYSLEELQRFLRSETSLPVKA